jgi:hypothetical protein
MDLRGEIAVLARFILRLLDFEIALSERERKRERGASNKRSAEQILFSIYF